MGLFLITHNWIWLVLGIMEGNDFFVCGYSTVPLVQGTLCSDGVGLVYISPMSKAVTPLG